MINIKFSEKILSETIAPSIALFVGQDEKGMQELKKVASTFFPQLQALAQQQDFSGQAGKILIVPVEYHHKILTIFVLGLGKKEDKKRYLESFRRALGLLIKSMQAKNIDTCCIQVPSSRIFGLTAHYLAKQIALMSAMAAYRFDEYITDPHRKVNQQISLELLVKGTEKKEMQRGIHEGTLMAESVNMVRHWVDLPPVALTPTALADKAKDIAKKYALDITVFDEATVKKMGMGGLAAVSAGSEQDCKFVILNYKTTRKNAPTLALVGKGITFDSGGLSLKPPKHMETMKEDMAGAAAVIGTMQVIAQVKPNINVIGITPLSENLPSDKATKPGDIVRFYNGKTAEIKNTDAEGRLILADALSYAVKQYKPDAIIDIATLTGACSYALGPFFTGMFGKHEELMKKIEKAAELSGDRVWRLPFDDDYKKAIISDVADICNIGKESYMAGATTAAFFLSHFVNEVPWVHLDIAGTAFNVPDISYYSPGATGVGVRLLSELVLTF